MWQSDTVITIPIIDVVVSFRLSAGSRHFGDLTASHLGSEWGGGGN